MNTHDFPDFSPKLEDYFTEFPQTPDRPSYSYAIDARYRLVMESGYGVFWIITDALNELNKGENNKIPYFSKIHLGIDYVGKLLQEGKVKVKIKESDNQGISRLYQGPEDSKVFIADARLLLDKKSKQGIENEENGVFDPYSGFFDLVHHEIYITLPYKDFWDETK